MRTKPAATGASADIVVRRRGCLVTTTATSKPAETKREPETPN
jgi:hypothetical protein